MTFPFYLPPNIANMFKDDVREYLDQNAIVFTPDFISKRAKPV